MRSPYRELAEAEVPEPKSGELVYRPCERTDRVTAGGAAFRAVVPPTLVGLWVGNASAVAGIAAVAGLLAASLLWKWKRPKDVVVLRVVRGTLRVYPMGSKREAFRIDLDALDDVVLETRSVERVLDVGAGIVNIGTGQLSPTIATATETKRIALEWRNGERTLTDEFFGHAETTEWFAKVRCFLRSVGWTPLSERDDDDQGDVQNASASSR